MEGERLPGLTALDEPTRGMDRDRKDDLVDLIEALAERGAGVVVATHDVEFAAAFAERVVLMGDGVLIADGPAQQILSGGWYFATEVARVLDTPGVITPEQGAAALLGAGGGPG
jgi:energy-coupling factor transport system ATP-binding protein